MVIERMQPEDMEQVFALQQALVPFPATLEQARESYRRISENSGYYLAVAREGDEILGTLTAIVCQGLTIRFLVLEDFIVKEDLRGSGIGTALMDAMEQFGRENDCFYAFLVSSGFRKQAHRFYEKRGYTEDVRGFRKDLQNW